jgi:hypothetical protein
MRQKLFFVNLVNKMEDRQRLKVSVWTARNISVDNVTRIINFLKLSGDMFFRINSLCLKL